MKGKIIMFLFTFVGYALIFLFRNNWNLASQQIAEMIFIATLLSLFTALVMNPMKRLIQNMLTKR